MNRDPSLAFRGLLVTQVALTLVYPFLGEAWSFRFLLGVFLMLALYGGVSITVTKPFKLWTSLILGVCFVGSYWVVAATDIHQIKIWVGLFGAAFFWFTAGILMKYIFSQRSQVDLDLIYGAVSVYLLIGSGFGQIYLAFAMADPSAFAGVEVTSDFDKVSRSLSYFSFVTLTTLGYGDITPAQHHVKVLAYFEAIIGQLYLTILVARLVGTYIAQSRDK